MSDFVGYKLRSIIVSDSNTFKPMKKVYPGNKLYYVDFTDASLEDMIKYPAGVDIHQ